MSVTSIIHYEQQWYAYLLMKKCSGDIKITLHFVFYYKIGEKAADLHTFEN